MTGSITHIGDIPPKTEAYFNTGECVVQLASGCDSINVVSYTLHAHFLGAAVWSNHYRPDKYGGLTYVRCICPCVPTHLLAVLCLVGRDFECCRHVG